MYLLLLEPTPLPGDIGENDLGGRNPCSKLSTLEASREPVSEFCPAAIRIGNPSIELQRMKSCFPNTVQQSWSCLQINGVFLLLFLSSLDFSAVSPPSCMSLVILDFYQLPGLGKPIMHPYTVCTHCLPWEVLNFIFLSPLEGYTVWVPSPCILKVNFVVHCVTYTMECPQFDELWPLSTSV